MLYSRCFNDPKFWTSRIFSNTNRLQCCVEIGCQGGVVFFIVEAEKSYAEEILEANSVTSASVAMNIKPAYKNQQFKNLMG